MKYLTALELSEKWGITSRMVTIHCKNGRINGAIKKGKVWLIPANAQKPVDERKATCNIVTIDENITEKGALSVYNKAETDNPRNPYYGVTILFTTHNLEIAKTADRIITLKDSLLQKDIKNEKPLSAFEMNWE